MLDSGYDYGEVFQLRLLSLLVKRPELVSGIVKANYFTNPMFIDIARIVQEVYERHPKDRLSKPTLRELAKANLGRKGQSHWPRYRKFIGRIFEIQLSDISLLQEQATLFAKETEVRDALVRAEQLVSNRMFDSAFERLEKVRQKWLRPSDPQTGVAGLPVFNFHQLLGTHFESDREYLVDVIIPRGGAILSYGLPKGLKSWFSTAVALDASIGDGKAVGYFGVSRPVRVLLVQVEDPASRTSSRLQQLLDARPFGRHPYPGDLKIITRCPMNLLDSQWVSKLEEVIAKQRTELAIFDVVRRLFRGNISSPEDTAAFLEVVDGLRDKYGLAAWMVHHANKGAENQMMTRALGSINLTAWGEVLLYFKDKRQSGRGTTCRLEIETKDQAIDHEFKVVLDDEAEPMLVVEEAKSGDDKLQLAASQLKDEWTVDQLAGVLGLKYAGAYKTTKSWIERGIAVEHDPGSKGHPARFRFVEKSDE